MKTSYRNSQVGCLAAAAVVMATLVGPLRAEHQAHLCDGVAGPSYSFTAKAGSISTSDGNSIYFWGYANGDGVAQYPGPTLIVNEGAQVTITLNNTLPVPVSIVFPEMVGVKATGGSLGLLTREATTNSGPVTYTFTASKPGTFLYHSGSQPDLQNEMGLLGAIIVRPAGFDPANHDTWKAYGDSDPDGNGPLRADSAFDQEFLFLLTEMDEDMHKAVETQVKAGQPIKVDTTAWWPVYWFINGRTGPDTVLPPYYRFLPNQPYDVMPLIHPGQRILMRVVGAGRDPHPFHHHGNHSRVIARNGRLLQSAPGQGADLSYQVFTIPAQPGTTHDSIFTWTGADLGWDIYGHKPEDPLEPFEDPDDHGKPIPVKLPTDQNLTFGQFYGGSPFLGAAANLPPGQGGFNPMGGLMFMWHSHAEKELVNNNIFPGGMLTFGAIVAWPQGTPAGP